MAHIPGQTVTLHRDRATWLIYTQLSLFAFFLYTFAPTITLLRDEEHVRDAVAALHSTAYAIGVVVVGLLAARTVARIGRERATWFFLGALCFSIALYASVPLLPLTLLGALLCGGAGAGVVTAVGSALMDRHGSAGPAAVTEANALAAAAGLIGPLAVGGAVSVGIGWRPAVLAIIVLIAVLYAVRRAFGVTGRDPRPATDRLVPAGTTEHAPLTNDPAFDISTEPPHSVRPLGRQFWLGWTVLVACVSIEFSMTLWSAQLLRDRAAASPALAATGVTALVGGMCVGRTIGSRLARRLRVDVLLFAAFAVTTLGFVVFWTATSSALAFAGLAVTGLGMALHYPLALSRSIGAAADQADRASSMATLGAGIAAGVAPFLLGLLADGITVRYAFLLVPMLLAIAAAMLLIARDRAQPRRTPRRGNRAAARLTPGGATEISADAQPIDIPG